MRANEQYPAEQVNARAELGSPDFWLFRLLPLRLVIPLLVLAIAGALIPIAVDAPWWSSAVLSTVITAVGLLPIGGVPLGLRLGRWVAYLFRRRRQAPTQEGVVDVPLPEGGHYGLRFDGDCLVTMLRIESPPDSLTWLRRGSLSTDQVVGLTDVAQCLHQFDIALDSIDVISTGARTASSDAVLSGYAATVAPLGRMYHQILGPLPAIAHRTMWIVLRLNPLANAKAVANRGGGSQGALRAALVATRRVANRLAAQGVRASVLTSAEMTNAMRELTRGIPLEQFTESADSLQHGGVHLTSYRLGRELINPDGLAQVWAVPSLATTVTMRLRPAETNADPTPAGWDSTIDIDARVRYDTGGAPDGPPLTGLRPFARRQLWALRDSLPMGRRGDDTTYQGPIAALAQITAPTTGCGQLIGADDSGSGIAVPLMGQGSRRIDIVGGIYLAQQVILRAIALGAGAVVHTDRPRAWQAMIANVGSPFALSLASRSQSGRYSIVGRNAHPPAATLIVFDGVPPTIPPGSATVVTIFRRFIQPRPGIDVTIVQHPNEAHTITVHTATTTATARMVTTPTEQQLIGTAPTR